VEAKPAWYRNPVIMGVGVLVLSVVWYLIVDVIL
jgi:hypothetical protein